MGAVDILRDALFGNPPSPNREPSREGVLSAFSSLSDGLNGALAGIVYYATGVARAADTSRPIGTIGKAADESDYYRREGSGWVVDNSIVTGLVAVVEPIVAEANEAAQIVTSAAAGYAVQVTATQGDTVNDWILTLPSGITLTDNLALQFDAPSTPTAVPTGPDDGIRIIVGTADYPLVFTDGPPVGVDARIQTPWRVFVRWFAPGNAFILERSSIDNRRIQLLEKALAAGNTTDEVGADDGRFFLSDYPIGSTIVREPTRLRITRPIADAFGQRYANPGTRLRCGINPGPNGGAITFLVRFLGLNGNVGVTPSANPVEILVNGASAAVKASPVGRDQVGYMEISAPLTAGASQLVELIWPYGWEMEVRGVRFPAGSMFNLDPSSIPRPAKVVQIAGDSIVQGYSADRTTHTYAYLLANALGLRLANNGYGGRLMLRADGTPYGAALAELTIYHAGINNMTSQFAPSTVYDEVYAFVLNFVAANPGGRLLVVTPVWNRHVDSDPQTYPGSAYRTQIENGVDAAIAAAGSPAAQVKRTNGLALMPNNAGALVEDGTHPTTANHATIASNLATIVNGFWPSL